MHYFTDGVNESGLYMMKWNVISGLQSWEFKINFVMQDGGQQNREFTKLHFKDEPKVHKFLTKSLVSPVEKVGFCKYFSHNIKKLKIAVLSSGNQPSRLGLLTKNGKQMCFLVRSIVAGCYLEREK